MKQPNNNNIAPVFEKVAATFDLGASGNKGIVQIYPHGVPIVLAMEPEIADVEKLSIEYLGQQRNSVWVGMGDEYYAFGALAKNAFAGTAALRDLKCHYALPKIVALLWLACRRLGLKEGVEAYVKLLLPPGEMSDGNDLRKDLALALKKGVITPTGKLKVKLRSFLVVPEGSGILTYRSRGLGSLFAKKNIGLLMLGYRNASFIVSNKANPGKSESTDLGMNWLVQKFVERTAVGLSVYDERLPLALVEANNGNLNLLRSLSRKSKTEGIESDLRLFNSVLPSVRASYCQALIQWIRNMGTFDEVLICGGTAEFVRTELNQYFQKEGISIVWNGGVEIPKPLDTLGLGQRVADVWTTHITHIKILDYNLGYERKQPLVSESYQSLVRNYPIEAETWENNGFLITPTII